MERGEADEEVVEQATLKVAAATVEVGGIYPIFGMITAIKNETPGEVVAEINYHILAHMNLHSPERVNLLKQRAFETGIFIAKVLALEPSIEVDCQTVIFGKNQAYQA